MNKSANAKICSHLSPFLTQLSDQGAGVIGIDESAWSNCRLNIVLNEGPSIAQAEKIFDLPAGVKLWHNDDTHYALENGLFCEQCKHSLSWGKPVKSE